MRSTAVSSSSSGSRRSCSSAFGGHPRRLVAPGVVEKELAQALAEDMRLGGAAGVELVHHAPDTAALGVGFAVGQAEVGIFQPIFGEVLAGAGQQHHPFTAGLQCHPCLLGHAQTTFDHPGGDFLWFAGAPGIGRTRQRQADGHQAGQQEPPAAERGAHAALG